jgi:DNA mismatch repair protein MutL
MGNKSKINILDTETSNQIAAGEVVERPVSVVKELIENAIDAGADRITISIKQNLKEDYIQRIEISDNGIGMNKEDLERAFLRHATSKMKKIEDLDSIFTLGFRGEALPSIASVSKVYIKSRSKDNATGYEGKVIDGRMIITGEIGIPVGTQIIVDDLFYNTPARKKFLKSASVEQGRITKLISNMILSSPQVAFVLKVNNRTVLHSSGNGSLQQCVIAVYGADILKNLLDVNYQEGGLSINGFVSKPPFSRSNRNYYHFFVNGRLVKSRELSVMFESAYDTLMPERRYPLGIIYIKINPNLIDVNVHPAKTEIRFRKIDQVRDAMSAAVKDALVPRVETQPEVSKPLLAKTKSNIEKSVGELTIESESGKSFKLSDLFSFGNNSDKEEKASLLKENSVDFQSQLLSDEPTIIPVDNEKNDLNMKASKESEFTSKLFSMLVGLDENNQKISSEKTNVVDNTKAEDIAQSEPDKQKENADPPNPYEIYNQYLGYYDDDNDGEKPVGGPPAGLNGIFNLGALFNSGSKKEENKFAKIDAEQEELFPKDENLFKVLKPLGQLNGGFIIAYLGADLYIIDQHAAHERILYEEFCKNFSKSNNEVSMLAVPVRIELGNLMKELLLQNLEAVTDFGFIVEYLGDSSFVLRGVPLWFAMGKDNVNVRRSDNFRQSAEDFFLDMMDRIVGNSQGESNAVDFSALNKEELFTMACKNAVKATSRLTEADITWLLQKLSEADKPQTCPHGRPTVIKISDEEIRKRFMRS